MVVRTVITLLCGVGFYASLFMLAKLRRAERGELPGPSVVKSPRAKLYGVPNTLLGAIYYPALAISIWLVRGPAATWAVLAAVIFAGLTSVVLAYSLLFITGRVCPYCWTAHAVNWSLMILSFWLFARPA
jgi:uncharacterized membrane protein